MILEEVPAPKGPVKVKGARAKNIEPPSEAWSVGQKHGPFHKHGAVICAHTLTIYPGRQHQRLASR
jgi:hypothetical protein